MSKKNVIVTIIVAIICLAIGAVGSYFITSKLLSDDKCTTQEKYEENENVNSSDNTDIKDDDTSNDDVSSSDAIFESNGFKFTIPSEYTYIIDDDMLEIKSTMFFLNFQLFNYSYEDAISVGLSEIIDTLKSEGYTIGEKKEYTYKNHKYYLVDFSTSGIKVTYYTTSLNSSYVVIGAISVETDDVYDDVYTAINSLIDNVTS